MLHFLCHYLIKVTVLGLADLPYPIRPINNNPLKIANHITTIHNVSERLKSLRVQRNHTR